MSPAPRIRTAGLAVAMLALPLIAVGCGDSESSGTAGGETRAAAGAKTCPEIAGAVATPLTVKNTSGRDVTLDAEDLCTTSAFSKTPLFSGTANPTLLDTTVPGDGTPLDVVFRGAPGLRGPVDLRWTVEGRTPHLPWSIRVSFGATDNAGAVVGWDESYEKYGEGPDMQSVTLDDGARVVVGISQSTISFTRE